MRTAYFPNLCRTGLAIGQGRIGVFARLSTAAALGACSSFPHLDAAVASYTASNVLSPSGYSQTKLDDTHYQVKAAGTEATPTARLEKIARARAAEIGVEDKLQYFKVTGVRPGFACTKKQAGYKSEPQPATGRPVVVLDVTYAHEVLDPGYVSSAESFKALSGQIAAEAVPRKPARPRPRKRVQVAGRDDGACLFPFEVVYRDRG